MKYAAIAIMVLFMLASACMFLAGCGDVSIKIPKSDSVTSSDVKTVSHWRKQLVAYETKRLQVETDHANQLSKIDPVIESIKRQLKEAEVVSAQKWHRIWASILLVVAVVLTVLSFRLPVLKGTLRTAACCCAALWATFLLWAAALPYMSWILLGFVVVAAAAIVYFAVKDHDKWFNAFKITSLVADKLPQDVKEEAFKEELQHNDEHTRESLKATRDEARATT